MKFSAILLGVCAVIACWFVGPEYIEMATNQKQERFVQPKKKDSVISASVTKTTMKDPFLWMIVGIVFVVFICVVVQLTFFMADKRLISLPIWVCGSFILLISISFFYPTHELKIVENGQVVVDGVFPSTMGLWFYLILFAMACLIGSYTVQKRALITKNA